jgi:hypothetical protein
MKSIKSVPIVLFHGSLKKYFKEAALWDII